MIPYRSTRVLSNERKYSGLKMLPLKAPRARLPITIRFHGQASSRVHSREFSIFRNPRVVSIKHRSRDTDNVDPFRMP